MKNFVTFNKNKDFRRLYFKGKSIASSVLVTYVMKNRLKKTRLGVTTSKKVGNAVKRNRARRVIKEAFRQICDNLKPGVDIVFVARSKTCLVKTEEVLKSMIYHLKKLGAWEQ